MKMGLRATTCRLQLSRVSAKQGKRREAAGTEEVITDYVRWARYQTSWISTNKQRISLYTAAVDNSEKRIEE